jgi:hypothetical protein
VASSDNREKAPSEISFGISSAAEHQWGFDISSNAPKLTLTKLQLEQQERIVELKSVLVALTALNAVCISGIDQINGLARAYSKQPEQIVAEYLRGVREWLAGSLPQYYDSAEWLSTIPIDLVVTVPSVSIQSMYYNAYGPLTWIRARRIQQRIVLYERLEKLGSITAPQNSKISEKSSPFQNRRLRRFTP